MYFCVLKVQPPPRANRTAPLVPYTTLFRSVRDALHQVIHQGTLHAPHGAAATRGFPRLDGDLAVRHLHRKIVHDGELQLALRALRGQSLASQLDLHALRHRNRMLADTRHRHTPQNTRQTTSPQTLPARAFTSDITPRGDDRT